MPRQQPTHTRRSLRLSQYDYTSAGMYFVTLCVHGRACILGDVVDDRMTLSAYGEIAAESWQWLAQQYPYVSLDAWVMMPNHLHGILIIEEEEQKGGSRAAPTGPSTEMHSAGVEAAGSSMLKRKPLGGWSARSRPSLASGSMLCVAHQDSPFGSVTTMST